jgi:hypothetical protein
MPTHANMTKTACPFTQEDRWCLPPEEFVSEAHPYFCPCAVAVNKRDEFDERPVPHDEQKWHCGLVKL